MHCSLSSHGRKARQDRENVLGFLPPMLVLWWSDTGRSGRIICDRGRTCCARRSIRIVIGRSTVFISTTTRYSSCRHRRVAEHGARKLGPVLRISHHGGSL